MISPYKGILLGGRYFGYDDSSWRESLKLRNEVTETQGLTRSASVLGKSKETFTISISLDSTYNVYAGSSFVGPTTWLGVSRKADFKSFIGAAGVSMPLDFVAPDGCTYSVVPVGAVEFPIFNPTNPGDSSTNGTEYRPSLTLEAL